MGWLELNMWLGVMQTTGPEQSPGSWAGTETDPTWQAMREQHYRAMGLTG
jgi:hypothetical protein